MMRGSSAKWDPEAFRQCALEAVPWYARSSPGQCHECLLPASSRVDSVVDRFWVGWKWREKTSGQPRNVWNAHRMPTTALPWLMSQPCGSKLWVTSRTLQIVQRAPSRRSPCLVC